MQNDWTMNIKQNVMSHTRITHDKFQTTIQNGCQSAIFIYFYYLKKKKLNLFFHYYGNLA